MTMEESLSERRARAWRETPEPPRDPFVDSISRFVRKEHEFISKQQDQLIAQLASLFRGEPQ